MSCQRSGRIALACPRGGRQVRRLPFRVQVIQTDNGAEFQSRFHWHVESLDVRHVYIRPRTPHLNGKVERSYRVDDQEFHQLLDQNGISDDIHLFNEKLREWDATPMCFPRHQEYWRARQELNLRPSA